MKKADLERLEKLREKLRRSIAVRTNPVEVGTTDLGFLIACADKLIALDAKLTEANERIEELLSSHALDVNEL